MRKIKRFTINVDGFRLSPEELRRINGGASPGCLTIPCYVYEKITGKFLDKGNCGDGYDDEGFAVCACNTPSGSYPAGGECDDN